MFITRGKFLVLSFLLSFLQPLNAQILLRPDRVFDGFEMHSQWVVLLQDATIQYAGPADGLSQPSGAEV
jgi:hypothetical protein